MPFATDIFTGGESEGPDAIGIPADGAEHSSDECGVRGEGDWILGTHK